VSFTDKEFSDLERLAHEEGVTVPYYIQSKVLKDTEFQQRFQDCLSALADIPKDTALTSKQYYRTDWISISKGIRLALADRY
jgi:hypothetical protein